MNKTDFIVDFEGPIKAALSACIRACEAGDSKAALNYASVAQSFLHSCPREPVGLGFGGLFATPTDHSN